MKNIRPVHLDDFAKEGLSNIRAAIVHLDFSLKTQRPRSVRNARTDGSSGSPQAKGARNARAARNEVIKVNLATPAQRGNTATMERTALLAQQESTP